MNKLIKSIHLYFVLPMLLNVFLNANSEIIPIKTNGYGGSEDQAITSALKKAIMEVNGVDMKANSKIQSSKGGIEIQEAEKNTSIKFQFENSTSAELKTQGLIDSYEIINISQNSTEWKVTLLANVIKYKLDTSTNRKKIALLPVEYKVKNTLAKKISQELQNEIESNLVQTRKFAVLSRTDINKVLTEQNFISYEEVNKSEKAKLGNLLGGDVLLLITIENVSYYVKKEKNDYVSTTNVIKHGELSINVKVLSAVTGEIKFSDTFTEVLNDTNKTLSDLIKNTALNAINNVVYSIYPTRITNVKENKVFINTGGKSVNENSIYSVFKSDERMIDPYTGESLGNSTIEIGTIKIIRVEPKYSVGLILEGNNIEKNMIVKLKNTNLNTPKESYYKPIGKESDTEIKKGGGVVLPFD